MLTKTEASTTYQPKGEYLTSIPAEYVTDEELNAKSYATTAQLANKVDTSTYTEDKATFALKSELTNFITASVDNLVNYYKKSETYTQSEIDAKIGAITTINFEVVAELPVSGEANKIYLVPNAEQSEQNVKDEYIWIENKWELIGSTKIDLSNYYNKGEVDTKLSTKVDLSTYNSDKSTFALKSEISDMATQTWVTSQGYLTSHQDISNLATKQEVTEGLATKQNKGDYATKSELANKADKTEIPTNISELINDSGYITSIPSEYITETELTGMGYATTTDLGNYVTTSTANSTFATKTELDSKQETLISGTNIKTVNGTSLLGSGDIAIESGIADAPSDGETYGRNNGNWVKVEAKAVNVYDLIMRVHQAAAAQTKVAQEDYNTLFGYLENGTSLYMYEGGNSIAIELTLDSDKMIIIFKTPISIAGQDCACFYISNSTLDVTLLSITFVNKDYIASTVLLKEYSKAKTYTPIIAEDTINSAIGKLEAGIGSGGVGKVDPNSDGTGLIFNDYENNVATGSYATAIGYKTQASGKASFAGGNASYRSDVIRAKGNSSIAIGSTSMGSITAQGSASIAMGYAGGQGNIITNGAASIAIGCVSTGADIESSGSGSVAIGYADYYRSLIASGRASSAFGVNTSSRQFAQMAIGSNNIEETSNDSFSLTNKAFIIGNGGQSPDAAKSNAFYVKFNGETHADGAYSSSGADYAEMFEWKDANPTDEDRVGRFVTFDGDKIRLANANDTYILGIISGTPTIVGDDPIRWQGKYLNDEWGRPIYEDVEVTYKEFEKQEDGTEIEVEKTRIDRVRKINPNFNPEEKYIPRSERQEWDFVGMMGKLLVKQDGTLIAGGFCKSIEGGIATKSENGYYVMKVINENQALVLFK